ncbi:MAG: alkaline phosphatase family protein [Candidatus Bathyarchaeota archaeon]|nr:MAG: alkaline phosphatase family protein [Candidatus Bathyarchaeota archaeon]
MIFEELKKAIEDECKVDDFIYPSYEKYCFSNIPATILKLLNVTTKRFALPPEIYKNQVEYEDSNKTILLLIDGYGYNQWLECYRRHDFFREISQKGVVSPITTVFPSTTAATITTMNTGLTPQEHALLEWYLYFKEIDLIINTLPFTPLGKKGQDWLIEMGANPKILYDGDTIHQTLKEEGVKSFTFTKVSYAQSCYSKIVHNGSTIIPFISYSDMFARLRKLIREEKGPAYFYAYLDNLDGIGHLYGPHSMEYSAELSLLSHSIKKQLLEKTDRKAAEETLLLITSDHGQVDVSPEDTIYLNRFPKLTRAFKKSEKGKPILPTGSPRDVFLHVEPDKLEATLTFLTKSLEEEAKTMKTNEALKRGLFGIGKPRKQFFERAGDLLILPFNNHTVWYEHIEGKKAHFLGYHGGLNEEEMLVPFAMTKLTELL